jgi:hypothetical protein
MYIYEPQPPNSNFRRKDQRITSRAAQGRAKGSSLATEHPAQLQS